MEKRPCPVCKKKVDLKTNSFAPFCSERCKKIDLGKWALEQYRIPGGLADKKSVDDEDEKEEE